MSRKLYAITLGYLFPEILAHTLIKGWRTAGFVPDRWIVVDHHWPIQPIATSIAVNGLARTIGAEVMRPEKNLGGHGGLNWVLQQIKPQPEDFILTYDGDSNPITQGWLLEMQRALDLYPELTSVSLMHEHILERGWQINAPTDGRPKLARIPLEMFNVTLWRGSTLAGGLKGLAASPYYGSVETAMNQQLNHAYLWDYREGGNPIPHHPLYTEWKFQHAIKGDQRNFDEYYRAKGGT